MPENIVKIDELRKVFRVHYREKEGLASALESLFNRKYKLIKAVDGVSFSIQKGEIRALIGPNGAGKSTIIKILSGILYPDSGRVEVMGLNPWKDRVKYVRNIGVLFGQKSQLIWELPAIDSFSFQKKMYDIPDQDYKNNLEYFTGLLNIEQVVTRPVRNLSLGERMKCELVCSLLHDPQLVFLDEPTIGLDLMAKAAIRNMVRHVNQSKNTTFILTTHDLSEIENLCQKITIINHGQVIFDDDFYKLRSLSSKKIVEVTFENEIDDEIMKKPNMTRLGENTVRFDIDTKESNFKDYFYDLFKNYLIEDINMKPLDIELIIRELYERKYC